MKFGICQELFEDWDWKRQCDYIAQVGYQGVEIAPFTLARSVSDISNSDRQQILATAKEAGLEIIGLHWLLAKTEGFHLTTADDSIRTNTADYLSDLARLCADLEGTIMVLGSPQQRNLEPGISIEQATSNAIDVFEQVLPTLQETGVTLALEPLSRHETDFMMTCQQAVEMMNRLDSPYIRLHQDVKAMSDEQAPIPELIHQFKQETVHFHANDVNLRGPGMGDVDFTPIFQALHDSNYSGWVSVEVFDYTPGVETIAQDSLNYMQRIWNEVAYST